VDNLTNESGVTAGEIGPQCNKPEPSMGTHLIKLGWRCVPNWVRHHILPYKPEYNIRRHAPLYCGLYVTFRCNLTCSWCVNPPLPEGLSLDDYEADVDSVSRLLDHPFFKSVAHINLTGGEPLMNKHIGEIIRLIRRRGFLVGIVTNGTLLENKVDELLEAGISDIRVSMYNNTVDRLSSVLPKLRGRLPVATSYIILKSELHGNPDAIVKAVRVSRDSGAVGTRLNFYMPAGQHGDEELVYEDDPELAKLKTRLAKEFPTYPVYWRTAVQRRIESAKDKTCRQPWENFHVDARGNLGLCCRYCFPDGKNGTLFETPLRDLLNSKRLNGLRAGILATGPVIPVDCTNCLYLGGGKAARKVLDSPLPTLIKKKLAARKAAPAASSES
jgi:Radical SAM superfamily/Iron-sulfur cluster-binding domain/4Fe-4S single cluster domain